MTISDNTLREFQQYFKKELNSIYDERELTNIWFLLLEVEFEMSRNFILTNPEHKISESEILRLNAIKKRLKKHEPIQYILNKAHFANMDLHVNEHVLIPRPETEELVHWVLDSLETEKKLSVLDIGTGSGCIPLALKKINPHLTVHGIDISQNAIDLAQINATNQHLDVQFSVLDITDKSQWERYKTLDVIISNPPYVLKNESAQMEPRVKNFEPNIALFVEDDDPFLFYKVISSFALNTMSNDGMLFFEINESKGEQMLQLMSSYGFRNIELRKDLNGKDRFIKAVL